MTRKSNRGVSIVEILIALTVFVILLIPIVSSVISGMERTTSAKELQYRNEYASNLMENVKEVPISVLDSVDSANPSVGDAADFFRGIGAKDVEVYKAGNVYKITGTTNLGIKNTEYAFQIDVDGTSYAAIHNSTNGVVEDLDQTKVALISAQLSNYDYSAYDTLLTKKMAKLQQTSTDYDPIKDVEKFSGDNCTRNIEIEISKNSSDQYVVKCILTYKDGSYSVDYVPYVNTFDKMPNIYLMYNVGVYNGKYTKDTITYDFASLSNEDVNVFVVATEADYASSAYKTLAGSEGVDLKDTSSSVLYRTASSGSRLVNSVTFSNKTPSKKNNLHVYHNFADIGLTVDCDVSATGGFQAGNVGSLTDVQNGRALYQVNIYMQKGDSVDTNIGPVLQGTRGGDEIE